MKVEVIVDKKYTEPNVKIYADRMTDEISYLLDIIQNKDKSQIHGFREDQLYIININDIFLIYSENGKVYAKTDDTTYLIKYRLYQLEEFLDKNFIRISNSEIINIRRVKNLDFAVLGTIKINFINDTYTYSSRRFIKKIKDYLKEGLKWNYLKKY